MKDDYYRERIVATAGASPNSKLGRVSPVEIQRILAVSNASRDLPRKATSIAMELSRGAEASRVYDRNFFFCFIAWHPSLGQWTGAITRVEGSLPRRTRKFFLSIRDPLFPISDLICYPREERSRTTSEYFLSDQQANSFVIYDNLNVLVAEWSTVPSVSYTLVFALR